MLDVTPVFEESLAPLRLLHLRTNGENHRFASYSSSRFGTNLSINMQKKMRLKKKKKTIVFILQKKLRLQKTKTLMFSFIQPLSIVYPIAIMSMIMLRLGCFFLWRHLGGAFNEMGGSWTCHAFVLKNSHSFCSKCCEAEGFSMAVAMLTDSAVPGSEFFSPTVNPFQTKGATKQQHRHLLQKQLGFVSR